MSKKAYYLVNENFLKDCIESKLKLSALECGGVDNWSYYGDALCEELDRMKKDLQVPKEEAEDFDYSDAAKSMLNYYEEEGEIEFFKEE